MELPSHLKVGPYVYQLVFTDDTIEDEGVECDGVTDKNNLKISINKSLAHEMFLDTVMHELLHTVVAVTGLDWEFGEKREERYIRALSPMLLDIFRRNPAVVRLLLSAAPLVTNTEVTFQEEQTHDHAH